MTEWSIDNRTRSARLRVRAIESPATPAGLLQALSRRPQPALLESAAVDRCWGRYSLIACHPCQVVTLGEGGFVDSAGRELPASTPREALKLALSAFRCERSQGLPYGPGWLGYVGYEYGRCLEKLPCRGVRDTLLPDVHLGFYDAVLVYDQGDRRWFLTWLEFDDGRACSPARDDLAKLLAQASTEAPAGGDDSPACRPAVPARSNFSPDAYRRAVARCVEYIAAGDIFQVNLSQRFAVEPAPEAVALYRSLRRRNPACYSAMLLLGESAVCSSSPELFLRLRNGQVVTRPIKGTRRRTGQVDVDAAAAAELLTSEKDNAELAMIIDLLRNDLGRVCRYGSVRVVNPRELETHPTVFHLVGTVVGELRQGVDAADLLAACFPGGSITGAPKIRAMEIIDELEGVARGVYTGSIGWFGANGDGELNIAIRTVVCDRGRALVQVGGGIVADSTPEGEYQETLDKARALLEAIAQADFTSRSAGR